MTFLAALGIYFITNLNDKMNTIVYSEYPKVALTTKIRFEFNNVVKGMRNMMLAKSEQEIQQEIDYVHNANLQAAQLFNELDPLITSAKGQQYFTQLKMAHQRYIDLINKEIVLIQSGNKSAAYELARTQSRDIQMDFLQSIENIIGLYEGEMKTAITESESLYTTMSKLMIILTVIGICLGIGISVWLTRDITHGLNRVSSTMTQFAEGKADTLTRIHVNTNDEISEVAKAFNTMAQAIEEQAEKERNLVMQNEDQAWLKSNIADMVTVLQSQKDMFSFAQSFIQKLTPLVKASHGVFYLSEISKDQTRLRLMGTYGYKQRKNISSSFHYGEGLVGQCALEQSPILLTEVPDDYIKINSGLGEAPPTNIMVVPITLENKTLAVFEVASFTPFTKNDQAFLEQLGDTVGIVIENIIGQIRTEELLKESQALTEELQTQSEELLTQQEEIEKAHTELEEHAKLLEEQNKKFEEKTQQLALTSKFKSEFLANMSHELRTPLNSLLVLSKLLADNKEQNLSEKQIEYSQTIYSSGSDLLALISEILDLSKVESGKMDVHPTSISFSEIKRFVEATFTPIATQKGIELTVKLHPQLPETIFTDEKRLQQILKNLLSNAFKFTHQGHVTLDLAPVNSHADSLPMVAFSIIDTGIGIPVEKQKIIFEAFQQADGTTSRKYGGTGLGLSICRELAALLEGKIEVESTEGRGSTFILKLPLYSKDEMDSIDSPPVESNLKDHPIERNIHNWEPTLANKKVLLVDDDIRNVFALSSVLETYNMEVFYAENGKEGVEQLHQHSDIDIVLMDIMMPEMNGYEAIQEIRKHDKYQDLPIIAVTAKAMKEDREKCLSAGASDYISKPVNIDQLLSLMRVWLYS